MIAALLSGILLGGLTVLALHRKREEASGPRSLSSSVIATRLMQRNGALLIDLAGPGPDTSGPMGALQDALQANPAIGVAVLVDALNALMSSSRAWPVSELERAPDGTPAWKGLRLPLPEGADPSRPLQWLDEGSGLPPYAMEQLAIFLGALYQQRPELMGGEGLAWVSSWMAACARHMAPGWTQADEPSPFRLAWATAYRTMAVALLIDAGAWRWGDPFMKTRAPGLPGPTLSARVAFARPLILGADALLQESVPPRKSPRSR